MSKEVFLGVVDRDNTIYLPWRGTYMFVEHNYEPGQNLLVTLEINENTVEVVKVELPTIKQLKQIKDELDSDWHRCSLVFKMVSMKDKVRMLRALDLVERQKERLECQD
jgi:hypothetical protein